MNMQQREIEFYERLREKLNESTRFPAVYLYKFIVPSEQEKMIFLREIFKNKEAKFTTKNSSSGKFTSFSVEIIAQNADEIIKFYQEASQIEGIVSL